MAKPHKLADGRYECQNCLRKFPRSKSPKAVIEPKFCGDPCRKEFHATGGMSLKKLETKVEQWVNRQNQALQEAFQLMRLAIEHLEQRIAALESRSRRRGDSPAGGMRHDAV